MARARLLQQAEGPRNRRFRKVRGRNPAVLFNRNFASNPVFLGTERVSGETVTDLFCQARDVPGNGAGDIGVAGRGAEKSAFKKKCEVEILTFF